MNLKQYMQTRRKSPLWIFIFTGILLLLLILFKQKTGDTVKDATQNLVLHVVFGPDTTEDNVYPLIFLINNQVLMTREINNQKATTDTLIPLKIPAGNLNFRLIGNSGNIDRDTVKYSGEPLITIHIVNHRFTR